MSLLKDWEWMYITEMEDEVFGNLNPLYRYRSLRYCIYRSRLVIGSRDNENVEHGQIELFIVRWDDEGGRRKVYKSPYEFPD